MVLILCIGSSGLVAPRGCWYPFSDARYVAKVSNSKVAKVSNSYDSELHSGLGIRNDRIPLALDKLEHTDT